MTEALGHRALVLSKIGEGARTGQIARQLGWSTQKARYYLLQLEREGKVVRHPRHTAENDIYWIGNSLTLSPIDPLNVEEGL